MPCHKISYSKHEAEEALKKAQKGRQYRREKRIYYCEQHNAFHLTSEEERQPVQSFRLKFFNKWYKLFNKK